MIEETIRNWVSHHRLSSGDDLMGFVIDCDAILPAQDAFLSADVKTTEDALSMVNAAVAIRPTAASLQNIADAFKSAWAQIAYHEFQAMSVRWYQEATVFRFITGDPSSRLGVTGTFIATGPHHPDLVQKFRAEFGELGVRVGQLPGGLPSWAAQLPHAGDGGRKVRG